MPVIIRDYHIQLIQTMKDLARHNKWWSAPINLGGVTGANGGSGIPIGGIFQRLIQQRITYDTTEAAYSGILTNVPSGTLVDNLAHIRYNISGLDDRVTVLEDESDPLQVEDESILVWSGVTVLDFQGDGVIATSPSIGRVTVTITSSSGLEVEDENISIETGVTVLDFQGDGVTATSPSPGRVTVTISGNDEVLHIYNELVSGIPATSGYVYPTANSFLPDTLRVYFNGLRQSPTYFDEEPTLSGFTTTFATETGDELLVDYNILGGYGDAGWGNEWGS